MTRKRKSRRAPRQERAKDTIALILESAGRVLVELGYAGTTTNHIAKKAGISIGSLYQYFDGKEEIISALLTEHTQRAEQVLMAKLGGAAGLPLEEVIDQTVAAIVDLHYSHYGLCSVFYRELPRDGEFRIMDEHFDRCAQMTEAFLVLRQDEIRVKNPRLAAAIIVQSVIGAIFGVQKSWKLPDRKSEILTELQSLCRLYLLDQSK